jgi:prevent-host-death family protein
VKTATIRDLRTRFPDVRRALDEEGEVVVTEHGRPVVVLRPWMGEERGEAPPRIDHFARLRARMPRPMTAAARRALDEANRGER